MHAITDFTSSLAGLLCALGAGTGAVLGYRRLARPMLPSRRVGIQIMVTILCSVYAAGSLCLLIVGLE